MKIIDFIVCDDIRHELGSKISILGIYNDKIRLQLQSGGELKWPLAMRLATYLRFEFESDDQNLDLVEIHCSINNQFVAKTSAQLVRSKDSNIGIFASVAQQFPLTAEGDLKFKIDFLSGTKVVKSFEAPLSVKIVVEKPEHVGSTVSLPI